MIVLFTDFGPGGPYTGQMTAYLATEVPSVPVVNWMDDAPRQNPKAASYLLAAYADAQRDSLVELEVNPLMVLADGVVAADVLMRLIPLRLEELLGDANANRTRSGSPSG